MIIHRAVLLIYPPIFCPPNKNIHAKETVHFIAWEPGTGTIGTVRFEAARTAAGVTNVWSSIPFQQAFQGAKTPPFGTPQKKIFRNPRSAPIWNFF